MLFCVLGVCRNGSLCTSVCLCIRTQKKCLASFIEEEDSVLKLHQHREINQSSAVINNRVIRSLFPR